jgi:hypothetical protein
MRSTLVNMQRTPCMQRVSPALRMRQHLCSPPVARTKDSGAPRYLIVTSSSAQQEIGRVSIKVNKPQISVRLHDMVL